jgi:hypothetical protein
VGAAGFGFAFTAGLAGWRVLDAGVLVELPRALGDFAVAAGLGFLLVLFDAAEVRGAAFGFLGEAGLTGDNRGWGDAVAEVALPSTVIGSGSAGPAAGVDDAVLVGRRTKPLRRAITALSQRITSPQQA